jgi:phage terminase large subunit
MDRVRLPHNGWQPRPKQLPLWNYLENGGKRAIAIWHRRFGKDEVLLHWAAVAAHERPATYWHMLPEYTQGRKAIWTAVNPHTGIRRIDEAFPKELRATTNDSEMFIRFKCGSTWQVVGSDRFDATVGSPPAGVTFSEWALSNPASWAYLAPILAENNGWAAFITTARGRNHAKSMLDMARASKEWFAEILTVDDTSAIPHHVVEAQRREYHSIFGVDAGDALIEQEYFCSFDVAVLGSYWGRELVAAEREGRVGKVDIDPSYPVHTAWDIGMDDPMAIWCFQVMPGIVNVVDYYESSGHGFDHYADWLDQRCYYGIDWVPHDAKVREPGANARMRKDSLMIERRKRWEERAKKNPGLAKPLAKICPDHKLMDGVNAGRITLPLARFDAERCAKGLECLREYKAEWDQVARVFKKTPDHNWASHGADAWRTLSVSWKEPVPDEVVAPMRGLREMTIEELWAAQPKRTADARI